MNSRPPMTVEQYKEMGDTFREQGRYDDALRAYDMALQLNPNDAVAHNNAGLALAKLNKYGDALQAYDRALRIDRNYADVYLRHGSKALDSVNVKQPSAPHL